MKVLITGGAGKCGTALVDLPHEKIFYDVAPCPDALRTETYVQADIGDPEKLVKAMTGCDAVIHLAHAWPTAQRNEEENCSRNCDSTRELIKTAAYLGVERFIFASSNHVTGMYEIENTPAILSADHPLTVDKHMPVQPDTHYGVSKSFSENFGRFYSKNGGPKFYALRIGSLFDEFQDHPYAAAENGVTGGLWERGSDDYEYQVKRVKATWMSRRDFVQMVDLCLRYDGPEFDIFYGVSNNTNRFWDIQDAQEKLGYAPEDNGSSVTTLPVSASAVIPRLDRGIHAAK